MPAAHQKLTGFAALKPLANQLKDAALKAEQERQVQAKKARLAAAKHAVESQLFQAEMQGVQPLSPNNRALPSLRKPAPVPRQHLADEKAALAATMSDEIDIEKLLETDETLSYRQPGLGVEVVRKLRRGEWAVQSQLDLHGLRVDEARSSLSGFLQEAKLNGLRCLRIIHGKGLGSAGKEPVLKGKVLKWLVQRDEVMAFCQARPNDGGSGALLVLLRG